MIVRFIYQWANLALLLLACGLAVWRGRWPERVAAAAMMVAWIASAFLHDGVQTTGPDTWVILIDALLFIVLLAIGLTSERWWPLWACAFHGLSVVLGLAMLADRRVWSAAGFIASGAFSYLTICSLLIGALGRATARRVATD